MAYKEPVPGLASGSVSSSNRALQYLNSPFGDTTYTKIFVGGLAWETQSDTLQCYFEQYGEILEAVVISDKYSGRSKGYGFVTFRHPESASRACFNPSPIIDGRRANCNLASLGRPQPLPPYGAYVGGSTYYQTLPYNYQQAIAYSPYGYTSSGPEFVYPQNVYNSYMGQQYIQVYGVPGALNTAIYPYGHLGQAIPASQAFSAAQAYTVPGQTFMQVGGVAINEVTESARPAVQAPIAG